jgi:hypothetical protein
MGSGVRAHVVGPRHAARTDRLWWGEEETMAEAKKSNLPRLLSLFIAFVGCVVVAVPIIFPLANPAPLILIGSGVTVVALAVFLFFSI